MTTVGIVGAGTMGAGIAQVVLAAGDEVVLHDVDPLAIERARERIADRPGARIRRRPAARAEALGRLRESVTLDALGAEAEVVIEAAIEDLDAQADDRARRSMRRPPRRRILATNTSALSVAAIAAAAGRPGRVLGLHWFNPVPRMALVEVVGHPTVDGEALAARDDAS